MTDPWTIRAQKYDWVSADDQVTIARMMRDDDWVLEQKLDGMRCLAWLSPNASPQFFSAMGVPLIQSAAVQWFPYLAAELSRFKMNGEVLMDGELMCGTGHLWLYDLPYVAGGGQVMAEPATRFEDRRFLLERLVELHPGERILLTPQARGYDAKKRLFDQVQENAAEGVMFKHLSARYGADGRRISDFLKVKFRRTADVIVAERNIGEGMSKRTGQVEPRCNARIQVYDEAGHLVPLGFVNMNHKPDAQPGDVIEVEFSSWVTGGKLVQPNMLRIRDDKAPDECLVTQLSPSSKSVIAH